MVGQEEILRPNGFLPTALRSGRIFSIIFWGPPGSGKTTLAKLVKSYCELPFYEFSAVTSGVKEIREIVHRAKAFKESSGRSSVLFVDEIHRFNKAQQDAFLPHVESGLIVLIGATTQNPSFEVIAPLLSRTRVVVLRSLGKEEITGILKKAVLDKERGLGNLQIEADEEALEFLAEVAEGDARVALNNLEAAVYHVLDRPAEFGKRVDLKAVETSLTKKPLPYDKDGEEHYNLISAFHKSLRGGDVQAGIYWLYRMLMAGEDPLFIARRMIRFATEDVGLAEPRSLSVALAAFDAWQKVGPPEAELALMEAVVYLAAAPKSNALYVAEKSVKKEIERSGALSVPYHIRNAPTALMKRMGYGRGYRYPHDFPEAKVRQEYLPDRLKERVFYRPSDRGFEPEVRKRMGGLRKSVRPGGRKPPNRPD